MLGLKQVKFLALLTVNVAGEVCVAGTGQCQVHSSLVQVKSVQDHIAVGTYEGGGAQAQQSVLLGFEKYLTNLVQKRQSEGPEHDTGLTDDERQAMETIQVFIDGMYESFVVQNQTDASYVNQQCAEDFSHNDEILDNNSDSLELVWSNSTGYKTDLTTCKAEEGALTANSTALCLEYNNYRIENNSALMPPCALVDGHLSDDHIRAETGSALLNEMEACLEEVHVWLGDLYPKYVKCRESESVLEEKVTECTGIQTHFEQRYCVFANEQHSACSRYHEQYKTDKSGCDETCGMVNVAVAARKADNESGARVSCLLSVLLMPNQNETTGETKTTSLEDCLNQAHITDDWDINCPPGGELPAYKNLHPDLPQCPSVPLTVDEVPCLPVPCSQEWVDSTYGYELSPSPDCIEECVKEQ